MLIELGTKYCQLSKQLWCEEDHTRPYEKANGLLNQRQDGCKERTAIYKEHLLIARKAVPSASRRNTDSADTA